MPCITGWTRAESLVIEISVPGPIESLLHVPAFTSCAPNTCTLGKSKTLTQTPSPCPAGEYMLGGRRVRKMGCRMSQDDRPPGSIDVEVGQLPGGVAVVAAGVTNAAALLTSLDTFVEQQSRFDRQARLNLSSDVVEVTLDMYLDYVGSQIVAWTPAELGLLKGEVLPAVARRLHGFEVELPEVIHLVKTTGQEEGRAAYTRHMNVIVLPQNMIVSMFAGSSGDPLHEGGATTYLTNIVLHELFHIISKNNPAIRSSLYEVVGYRETGDPVELPRVPGRTPTRRRSCRI